MRRHFFAGCLVVGFGLFGIFSACGTDGTPSEATVEKIPPPTGSESGQPFLFARGDTAWLSWVEPVDSVRHALRYASLSDSGWSSAATVARGSDWFVNWADVPSVRPLPGGRMAGHFLKSSGPSVYAYDVQIIQSKEGKTWTSPVTPHTDGTPTEHGFVSLLPHGPDHLMAVWLDGRKMASGDGPMTLRSGILDASGTVVRTTELDGQTCECCPTTAVQTGSGVLVAYRDRTDAEIRNIAVVRHDGTRWSAPTRVHDDGWKINGCPVNGPALDANGNRVVAAWFTGADAAPRVQVAFSEDGGQTFGSPVTVQTGAPQGYVDVALLADGSAAVSWKDNTADGAALRARRMQTHGSAGPVQTIAAPLPAGRSGMPRMVRRGSTLLFAWTEANPDGTAHVQAAHLATSSLP